jgi:hypothetical protein
LPEGSKLKNHQDCIVQDIIIGNRNTCYRWQRLQTPSDDYLSGQLPNEVFGNHIGLTLIALILYQYYGCHATQPLIKEQLHELGVRISLGQINNIIIKNKQRIHKEKKQILSSAATDKRFSPRLNFISLLTCLSVATLCLP